MGFNPLSRLSVCVCIRLSVCSVGVSVCQCVVLSVCPSVSGSLCRCVRLSVGGSVGVSVYQWVVLSVCVSVGGSVCQCQLVLLTGQWRGSRERAVLMHKETQRSKEGSLTFLHTRLLRQVPWTTQHKGIDNDQLYIPAPHPSHTPPPLRLLLLFTAALM